MHVYDWYLWIAPNVLCALAVVPALRRKCYDRLPWFFFNLCYFPLQAAAGIALIRFPLVYRKFVLFSILASAAIALAMIYELAQKLILSHSSLAHLLRPLPRWSAAVLVLLATLAAALFYPRVQTGQLAMTLSVSTNLIAVGLLLTLVLVAHTVGVSWSTLAAGVALGLGISATGELAGSALFGQPGKAILGDGIRLGSWHVCVLVWFVYLLLPEKAVSTSEAVVQMSQLEPTSQELHRLFQP